MAWTAPRTWVADEYVDETLLNTHLRDNLVALAAAQPLIIPSARVTHNAAQNVTHEGTTTLAFNTERWDTDTIHNTSTNNSRLTCVTAGIYIITCNVMWSTGDTDFGHKLRLLLNGSTIIAENHALNLYGFGQGISTIYKLDATDYVEVQAYQNSGSTLTITTVGNYSPEFAMTFLGKAA